MQDRPRTQPRLILSVEPDRYPGAVRDAFAGVDLVSLLYDTTPDEWRRTWRAAVGSPPKRELLCNVAEFTRGATSRDTAVPPGGRVQQIPGRDLAMGTFERPVDPEAFVETVSERVRGRDPDEMLVYLDALETLVADAGIESVVAAFDRLREVLPDSATIVCQIDTTDVAPSDWSRLTGAATDVEGEAPGECVLTAVDRLKRTAPTNYGYARSHWREARRGVEACDRNYPQAKQIHAAIASPKTTPRTLGATLKAFVDLSVIDVWGDTVGATRYDLTAYDPERLAAVGDALDASE